MEREGDCSARSAEAAIKKPETIKEKLDADIPALKQRDLVPAKSSEWSQRITRQKMKRSRSMAQFRFDKESSFCGMGSVSQPQQAFDGLPDRPRGRRVAREYNRPLV